MSISCYGDKPKSYVERFGQLLPAADVCGRSIADSNSIIKALEEQFPETPLMPLAATEAGQRAQALLALEREVFGTWLNYLTSGWGGPDRFVQALDRVEQALAVGGGPFMLSGVSGIETVADGSGFSIVDIMFAPFLERIAASIPYFKGDKVRAAGGRGRWGGSGGRPGREGVGAGGRGGWLRRALRTGSCVPKIRLIFPASSMDFAFSEENVSDMPPPPGGGGVSRSNSLAVG